MFLIFIEFFHDFVFSCKKDKLWWLLSNCGKCVTKSVYHDFRCKHQDVELFWFVWNKFIPPKVSFLVWRILNKALPVDDLIKSQGISMASCCLCCHMRDEENLNHLFLKGSVASCVWARFSCVLGLNFKCDSIQVFINLWFSCSNFTSQIGLVVYLWVVLCNGVYGSLEMMPNIMGRL